MCSGVNEFECLARDAFKRGQTFRGRREQSLCKGWVPAEQRTRDTWALLAISVSVCAVQLTQLGPIYNSERIFFFPWLVGWLFYFQITQQTGNKEDIKQNDKQSSTHYTAQLGSSVWLSWRGGSSRGCASLAVTHFFSDLPFYPMTMKGLFI